MPSEPSVSRLFSPRSARARSGAPVAVALAAVMLAIGWVIASVLPVAASTSASDVTSAPSIRVADAASTPPASTADQPASAAPTWQTAWAAAMNFHDSGNVPAADATVRDIAAAAVGGTAVQVRLSNTWGTFPATFGAVTIGIQGSGAAVVPGSLHQVTFGGSSTVTVPTGQFVTSDPVAMTIQAGQHLAVSMWVPNLTPVTVHYCCLGHIDSYFTPDYGGNQVANTSSIPFTASSPHIRWLSAVVVAGSPSQGTVVAFGDSITDGFNAQGFSWVKPLNQRMSGLPPADRMAVVNEGILGNTLIAGPFPRPTYDFTSGGKPGLARLGTDALSLPGAKDVVLFLGTNDLWFGATAQQVIAGAQNFIAQVHAAGLKAFGVTLLPRQGNIDDGIPWTSTMETYRQQVNQWILSPASGFDGVFDLASVMSDVYNGACNPQAMYPPYDSGDHLHPNAAGQTAMANAIPTTLFGMPEAPQVAPLVPVTLTPNCPQAAVTAAVLAAAAPTTTTTTTTTTTPPVDPRPHPPARGGHGGVLFLVVGAVALAAIVAIAVSARRRANRRRRLARIAAYRARVRSQIG